MVIVNNKGFSLIELLAIVIIITIVALISIPIVLNAVNSKKASQYRKSIDDYGKTIEVAFEKYKSEHDGLSTTDFETIKEYFDESNENVKCRTIKINNNGTVKITNCSVDNSKVLDENGNAYIYETVNAK